MSARLGPSQSSARQPPERVRASAAALRGRRVLLEPAEHLARIATGLHGQPDVLLHVELDLVPGRIGRRRQPRVRQRGHELTGASGVIQVHVGQNVSQGQVIGLVGCTGLCFGDHLHFEVRINGAVTNPLNYL